MTLLDPILGGSMQPGGDLVAGTEPNTQVVVGLRGRPIGSGTPQIGDVYVWDGTSFVATTLADLIAQVITDLVIAGDIAAGGDLTGTSLQTTGNIRAGEDLSAGGLLNLGDHSSVRQPGDYSLHAEVAVDASRTVVQLAPVVTVSDASLVGAKRLRHTFDNWHKTITAGLQSQDFNIGTIDGVAWTGTVRHCTITIDAQLTGQTNTSPPTTIGAARCRSVWEWDGDASALVLIDQTACDDELVDSSYKTLIVLQFSLVSGTVVALNWQHPNALNDTQVNWGMELNVNIARLPWDAP